MRGTGLQHPPFYSAHFCPTHQKQPPPTTATLPPSLLPPPPSPLRPTSPPPRRAVIGRLMGCLCCRCCCCCCCGAAPHGPRAPNLCPLPVRDICQRFRTCRGEWREKREVVVLKTPVKRRIVCNLFAENVVAAQTPKTRTQRAASHTRAREQTPSSSSSSSSDNI